MDDYKNTKEGRIVGQKYADILQMERPEPSVKHPRMSLEPVLKPNTCVQNANVVN